jgi:hypothetical protein
MTLYSAQDRFCNDQAITATAKSEDVIFAGPGDDGSGEKMDIDVIVTEAFNNLTSLQVQLRTDDNSGMSSPTVLYETAAIPLASLVVGYKFAIKGIPPGCEDYLDLNFIVVGTAPTTGKIYAAKTPYSADNSPSFS